jgi:membrane protein YdbS with pleckstrin-like domain
MKTNKATPEGLPERQKKKWNYVFLESLKMALFLPLVILAVEIFLLDSWPDWRDRYLQLAYDYLFLFSMIFLIFVLFHLIRWHRHKQFSED